MIWSPAESHLWWGWTLPPGAWRRGARTTAAVQRAKELPEATMEEAGGAGAAAEKTAPPLPVRAAHAVKADAVAVTALALKMPPPFSWARHAVNVLPPEADAPEAAKTQPPCARAVRG